jgi:ABC-2 type transport system ATP-binding protein
MRQRLGIAASLLRDPRLLLLDEPTNGLDPGGIRDMRVLIGRLAEQGITILLSSHLLAEVEELCDRVAIIRNGKIVYEGSIDELRARRSANRYRLRTTDVERARMIALDAPGVSDVVVDRAELLFGADEEAVEELARAVVNAGLGLRALVPETATLEALFFEMTEGEMETAAAGVSE